MALWLDLARASPPGSPQSNTACLPVVRCWRGVQATTASGATPLVGVCDLCHARQKRARCNERAALPPAYTPPPSSPVIQLVFDTALVAKALPRGVNAPPPHTPPLLIRYMQRVEGHFTAPAPVPVAATAQQKHSIDSGPQELATADAAASSASVQGSDKPAIPTCQAFLYGLMAGKYGGEQDALVLEPISHAILLRGERPEIRLKHKNGRVHLYAR